MSDIQVSIKTTEICNVIYHNAFTATPGKQLQLEIKTSTKVRLNMATPLSAVLDFTFLAEDEEEKVKLQIETLTPITVSSFIDNLDKVIQNEFLPSIMLAVNEKIRTITSTLGINLKTPNILLTYKKEQD